MMNEAIIDYLTSQGLLKVSETDVQIAQMTLNAVCSLEYQHISVDTELSIHFPENTEQVMRPLAALHASLDSLVEKHSLDSVAIYALVATEKIRKLIKVANFGTPQAAELSWNQDKHIAVQVAQSAWALVIDEVTLWQDIHPQSSVLDSRVSSLMCLPICTPTGSVLGVVYAESFTKKGISCEHQAWLVALALSACHILAQLPWSDSMA